MKRISIFFLLATLLIPSSVSLRAATLVPGDLIKASGPAVYYFHENGTRYVFPNEKTYFTWYQGFSTVKTITDLELAAIQLGGNVTYRPGVRLVKISTDPKVYAVSGKTLRWVQSETLAKTLYGDAWATTQVDDIPDAYFSDYGIGEAINEAADYDRATARDAYTSIGALPTPAPVPEPEPEPAPAPAPTGFNLTITPSKTEAQANENITLTAVTSYTGTIQKMEIHVNGDTYHTCNGAPSCTTSWTIPTAGTKSTYTYTVKLFTQNDGAFQATSMTTIVSEPIHASIQLTFDRSEIKPNQPAAIRSLVLQGLVASRNEIFVDGVAVKACTTNPGDCRFNDYIAGAVGSTHEVYAKVKTPAGLTYRSETKTLKISENDTPMISLTAGKGEIYANETVDITTTASDDDGISYVDISFEGQLLKHCIGAAPCTVFAGPFEGKPSGTILSFDAVAVDTKNATGTAEGGFVIIK